MKYNSRISILKTYKFFENNNRLYRRAYLYMLDINNPFFNEF